ncbi:4'-phosphopantetheinyl transferase superfamily protein [Dickeya dianthicola]|uniref:4'-phosphopantetheinyl transferase n=1 Tax=Dickeya dianthicola TaxID=204039 RepID=A0AAX1C4H5_9GAMM|nr:4'-phosphopantetheinyl transferase superfamily protein [Dickeya dianthicola]MZG32769.1 4'-phosphopantetheinyl transferase superfamily protein [Dickeya dianthicola]PWD71787.1 4'-phosphopantetheinyl transferase [Dickeya dianthicola]RJL67647.1 4'-phosphopantetheinyl transferase superfamily protein [Dickeya dianthicola]RJL71362.1 4'-phosphopantetheinyl transferase superfamily protein [Dickeya dianthicola]UOO20005.1 4'-phosphopantetheinyl transferase superfamily protein [Dickeya dianthicola]
MQKAVSSISSCRWDDLTARTWPYPHCVVVPRAQLVCPAIVAQARLACGVPPDAALASRRLAEGMLRILLAPLCQQEAAALRFERTPHGKPFLPQHPAVQFNLSHTQSAFAFAFARHSPVGVDVESCQGHVDRKRSVARRFFHPDEICWLDSLDDARFLPAFTCLWSRKEAYIKALGLGLHKSLASFSCLADSQGGIRVTDAGQISDCWLDEAWITGAPTIALSYCLFPAKSVEPDAWRLLILPDDAPGNDALLQQP